MDEAVGLLLQTLTLVCQSLLVGGCAFALIGGNDKGNRRWVAVAALATACAAAVTLTLALAQLTATLDISVAEALGAEFATTGLGMIATALIAALLCLMPSTRRGWPWLPLLAAGVVVLLSAAAGHANSRLEYRWPLIAVAFAHQTAAGVWLGGIPFLLAALRRAPDGRARIAICRRFSAAAALAVAVLAASAAVLGWAYVGSWAALAGSDFGVLVMLKLALFASLLMLGFGNLRAGPRLDQAAPYRRLRIFATAEIGLGIAVLALAATLAVQPPPDGEATLTVPAPHDRHG